MRQSHLTLFLVVMMGLVSVLSGCSAEDRNAEPTAVEKTYEHAWGNTVIKGTPKTIVALDFSFVDTLVALEVYPAGIANVNKSQVPDYVADKVKDFTNVGERSRPNLDLIRSVHPDLIIASSDRHEMIQQQLQEIAPTIALDDNSYLEVLDNLMLIGEIVGKTDQARQVKQGLADKMAAARQQVNTNRTVLIGGAFDDTFSIWMKDSFVGSLMSDIGMIYAYEDLEIQTKGYAEVGLLTMQQLVEIDPDYLFVYGDLKKWESNWQYRNLFSNRTGGKKEVNRNLWSRGRGPLAAGLILDEAVPVLSGQAK